MKIRSSYIVYATISPFLVFLIVYLIIYPIVLQQQLRNYSYFEKPYNGEISTLTGILGISDDIVSKMATKKGKISVYFIESTDPVTISVIKNNEIVCSSLSFVKTESIGKFEFNGNDFYPLFRDSVPIILLHERQRNENFKTIVFKEPYLIVEKDQGDDFIYYRGSFNMVGLYSDKLLGTISFPFIEFNELLILRKNGDIYFVFNNGLGKTGIKNLIKKKLIE